MEKELEGHKDGSLKKVKTLLIIKADTNDADYVYDIIEITPEMDKKYGVKILPLVKKIASILKEKEKEVKWCHNWDISEYGDEDNRPKKIYKDLLTKDEFDIFDDFIPYGEYGIHTICSIRILKIIEDKELL